VNSFLDSACAGAALGYGLLAGGVIKMSTLIPALGKDTIVFQGLGGDGLGRYLQGSTGTTGGAFNGQNRLATEISWGGQLGYQHWWTETLCSTVAYGHDRCFNDHSIVPTTATRTEDSLHANPIWSPVEKSNIGVEYMYGQRQIDAPSTSASSNRGTGSRFQVGLQCRF
jgi:hypothetical protein